MRMTRGRDRGINVFLWVCPLAGIVGFVGTVLARKAGPPIVDGIESQYFEVPSTILLVLLGSAILVPFIISLLTRRLLGFLAGANLMLLLVAGAGWIRSHQATDTIRWHAIIEGPTTWHTRAAVFVSRAGASSLELFRSQDETIGREFREKPPGDGPRQTLCCMRWGPGGDRPSRSGDFRTTPAALRRIGFGLAIDPKPEQRVDVCNVPFAIAFPYWFLCLLSMPLPLAWTMRLRNRRRVARRAASGLCVGCGYDLRATPDRCPECGIFSEVKA